MFRLRFRDCRNSCRLGFCLSCLLVTLPVIAGEKEAAVTTVSSESTSHASVGLFQRPADSGRRGALTQIGSGDSRIPVAVVRGTPYEMGHQLGELLRPQIQQFVPAAMEGILRELHVSEQTLVEVWARSAAFTFAASSAAQPARSHSAEGVCNP